MAAQCPGGSPIFASLPLLSRRFVMEDFSFGGCTGWGAGVTLMSAAVVTKQAASAHPAGRQESRLLRRLWVGLAPASPMLSDPYS